MSRNDEASIWPGTLESFCDSVAAVQPMPASVTAAAVTARIGLGLLIKALEISGKRGDFSGEHRRLAALIEGARRESVRQTQAADDDVVAYQRYMDCLRLPKVTSEQRDQRKLAVDAAARKTIDVPMSAARSAVAGLELCAEATAMVNVRVSAELGGAACLLAGAVRAMLLCVDSNARHLRSDPHYHTRLTVERQDLENRALQLTNATLRPLRPIETPDSSVVC